MINFKNVSQCCCNVTNQRSRRGPMRADLFSPFATVCICLSFGVMKTLPYTESVLTKTPCNKPAVDKQQWACTHAGNHYHYGSGTALGSDPSLPIQASTRYRRTSRTGSGHVLVQYYAISSCRKLHIERIQKQHKVYVGVDVMLLN